MWGYAIVCLGVVGIILYYILVNKCYIQIIKGIYLTAVIVLTSLMPYIVRLTSDFKPRIYYPLGAYFGIACTYGLLMGVFRLSEFERQRRDVVMISLVALLMVIQWFSFWQMYTDAYITNYEDKYISQMIGACIDEYEVNTGEKVDSVVFYDDAVKTKYCTEGWRIIQRGYSAWSERYVLNMYLNRDYKAGRRDETIAMRFSSKNWDCFSDEQIIIQDYTAHICRY